MSLPLVISELQNDLDINGICNITIVDNPYEFGIIRDEFIDNPFVLE